MTSSRSLRTLALGGLLAVAATLAATAARQPQTTARSALNGVTMTPTAIARGGILAVVGSDLAGDAARASSAPLPLALGDPPVEVFVNGIAAPLFSVSSTRISAQVPWEILAGPAQVVVRRGGAESVPIPISIVEANPNLYTHEGTSSLVAQDPAAAAAGKAEPLYLGGAGPPRAAVGAPMDPAAALTPGQIVTVFAAGLGPTSPPLTTGAAGAGSVPVLPQRAYLGGVPVPVVSATSSAEQVGVYELQFEVPELARSGEPFRWYSGNSGSAAVLGAPGPLEVRYMPVSPGDAPARRLDLSDLNPYFVAVSGPVDEDFCYRNVELLDFRRESARILPNCLMPSNPLAENENQFRPFERAQNTPVLAALTEPSDSLESGVTDTLLLLDGADWSPRTVTVAGTGVDRLQPALGSSPLLRLQRTGQAGAFALLDPAGVAAGQLERQEPLPDPLEVDGRTRVVAAGANLGLGYRLRFLGAEAEAGDLGPIAVLYNREAAVVAKVPFPDGWLPLVKPRAVNAQGQPQGNNLAPVANGFAGDPTAYVAARSAAGSGDAVVAFRAELPGSLDAPPPAAVSLKASATPFPSGSFVANCAPAVGWQRIPHTRSLAILGADEVLGEWADPRAGELCVGDRLVVFDTASGGIQSVRAPDRLRVTSKGALQSYLYFGEGSIAAPLEAPRKIHVYDGAGGMFKQIELPGDVGVTFNQSTQRLPGRAQLLALATGGPPRTIARTGRTAPPQAGNRGLLLVDLPSATATRLALPDGVQRLIAGPPALRGYGVLPLVRKAFARALLTPLGPGNPGGSVMLTWDLDTGEATELPHPQDGFSVVQRFGAGGAPRPALWARSDKAAGFAFGVFNRAGDLVSVGVAGL